MIELTVGPHRRVVGNPSGVTGNAMSPFLPIMQNVRGRLRHLKIGAAINATHTLPTPAIAADSAGGVSDDLTPR
jgi:hypothetical protein